VYNAGTQTNARGCIMRYFTLAILIVIAAAIGVLVAVLLAEPSDTTLAVTTQPREDQIPIYSTIPAGSATNWGFALGGDRPMYMAALDPSDYPSGSVFRFEAILTGAAPPSTLCTRLFDVTANAAVAGTELCQDLDPYQSIRLRSQPASLLNGEHEYAVQTNCLASCSDTGVYSARVIVEWEEELVMEPGSPVVGGIVELQRGADAHSDQPASSDPLPIGASVAVGVVMLGAGGLYVVNLRRS
jgi:hypothetical protein